MIKEKEQTDLIEFGWEQSLPGDNICEPRL